MPAGNLMTLKNVKVQDKQFESFLYKYLKFLSKYFAENGTKNKCQNEYYPHNSNLITFCILAHSKVPHFFTKGICHHTENG